MSFVSDLAMKGATKLASIPPDIFAAVITDYIENGTPSYKSAHGEGITEKLWGEVGVWFSCGTHARIDADAILAEWLRLADNQDSHKAALVSLTEEYFKRAVAAASNPASLDDLESFDMIFDRLQSLGMMDLMKGKMRGVIEPLISGLAMTPAQEELASNLLS